MFYHNINIDGFGILLLQFVIFPPAVGLGLNPFLEMERHLVELSAQFILKGYLFWCQKMSLSPELHALYPESVLGEDNLEPFEDCKYFNNCSICKYFKYFNHVVFLLLGYARCCYKFELTDDVAELMDQMVVPELTDFQESPSQLITQNLDQMKYNREFITFYVGFYQKKIEADWREVLTKINQNVPLIEDCLARVLRKENAEQEAMRLLGKSWEEMNDVTIMFHKAISAHKLDNDDGKFIDCMRGKYNFIRF